MDALTALPALGMSSDTAAALPLALQQRGVAVLSDMKPHKLATFLQQLQRLGTLDAPLMATAAAQLLPCVGQLPLFSALNLFHTYTRAATHAAGAEVGRAATRRGEKQPLQLLLPALLERLTSLLPQLLAQPEEAAKLRVALLGPAGALPELGRTKAALLAQLPQELGSATAA